MLRFLLLSGWRESEALSLEWSQVDFARGVATLPDTKTGRSVRNLGAPALAIVESMRAYRRVGSPFDFPGVKLGAHYMHAARHAAGLPDVRLHDLRHAFASVAASGGLTLPLIGALLGHTNSATTALRSLGGVEPAAGRRSSLHRHRSGVGWPYAASISGSAGAR